MDKKYRIHLKLCSSLICSPKISSLLSDSVGEKVSVQTRVAEKENMLVILENDNDDIDKIMSQMPQDLVSPQQNQSNVIPRPVFAPVLHNCNNITFHVNISK